MIFGYWRGAGYGVDEGVGCCPVREWSCPSDQCSRVCPIVAVCHYNNKHDANGTLTLVTPRFSMAGIVYPRQT